MSKRWYLEMLIVRYEGTLAGPNPLAWKLAIRYFIIRKMSGQPRSCTLTEPTPQRQVIFAATPGTSSVPYPSFHYSYKKYLCINIIYQHQEILFLRSSCKTFISVWGIDNINKTYCVEKERCRRCTWKKCIILHRTTLLRMRDLIVEGNQIDLSFHGQIG